MSALTATAENVLSKLKQLQATHEKTGNLNKPIGIDTLAMIFSTSFDSIMAILQRLAHEGKVQISYRTEEAKKTGKNKVAYVRLPD